MSLILEMRPQDVPLSWEEFLEKTGPRSIAIDGYVRGAPFTDFEGRRLNINHHEDVDRLATRASCAQVRMLMLQGLPDFLSDERGYQVTVYANDCDEDVCATVFQFEHPFLCDHASAPALNRFIFMADALDATAGAYPFPVTLPLLKQLAWINAPYRSLRMSGGLARRDAEEFRGVVVDVGNRIMQHITGNGGEVDLDTRYRKIGGGPGWSLVEEVGAHARTKLFADGIKAFISARDRGDGRYTYSVGRMSPLINFPVLGLLKYFNVIEGSHADPWGGSDLIGGSGRVTGSRLTPSEIEDATNTLLVSL